MTSATEEKAYSIFNNRTIEDIHKGIQEVYLSDARPWVVGYSGGKDSTTALQLIWYALEELSARSTTKTRFTSSPPTRWLKPQ